MINLHKQALTALIEAGEFKWAFGYGKRQGCEDLVEKMVADWLKA